MNRFGWPLGQARWRQSLVSGLCLAVLFPAAGVQAESASYEMAYTLGRDAHEAFSTHGSLRPGFRNDIDRGAGVNLSLRSRPLPSLIDDSLDTHLIQTQGVFQQRFAETGFGYGINFGLGIVYPAQGAASRNFYPGEPDTFLIGDISAGPTYRFGAFESGLRLGVRQSVFSNSDSEGPGSRSVFRDYSKSGGYLSLDGRFQTSRGAELSLSVFVDDPDLFGSRDWRSEGLNFDGPGTSTLGFEMGLNF